LQTTLNDDCVDAFAAKIFDSRPLIADAGPDQGVNKRDLATLDGSGSSDPKGDAIVARDAAQVWEAKMVDLGMTIRTG
jgi:hypothetical protein